MNVPATHSLYAFGQQRQEPGSSAYGGRVRWTHKPSPAFRGSQPAEMLGAGRRVQRGWLAESFGRRPQYPLTMDKSHLDEIRMPPNGFRPRVPSRCGDAILLTGENVNAHAGGDLLGSGAARSLDSKPVSDLSPCRAGGGEMVEPGQKRNSRGCGRRSMIDPECQADLRSQFRRAGQVAGEVCRIEPTTFGDDSVVQVAAARQLPSSAAFFRSPSDKSATMRIKRQDLGFLCIAAGVGVGHGLLTFSTEAGIVASITA